MKLSSLRINDIGKLGDKKFIVVDRCPEDRSSGLTSILFFDDKSRRDFYWDHENPEITPMGRGRVDVKIVEED